MELREVMLVISNYLLKGLAEFFGTAVLVFVGCMSCVFGLTRSKSTIANTSTGFGIAVLISVQIFGCISQAHVNPAVTLAIFILNLITWKMAIVYVIAQFAGAYFGYIILYILTPHEMVGNKTTVGVMCVTEVHNSLTTLQGFFVEFMITGILAFVVCGVFHPRNQTNFDSVSIRFGLTVWGLALIGTPYTGASLNPARSFAPAVYNDNYDDLWLYLTAPFAGSFVFTYIYKIAFINYTPPGPKMLTDDDRILPGYNDSKIEPEY